MAQRTLHYLFGEIFSQRFDIKDKNRFILGSIMPDAYSDPSDRDTTHFKIRTGSRIYIDFNTFREQYSEMIFKDDLYLGYYMHLTEDAFYRRFIYSGRFSMPKNSEEVAVLHNDYHILNHYIVNKYGLKNTLCCPENIGNECINRIADFRVRDFLAEMSADFTENTKGQTHFINEAAADEYAAEFIPIGLKELECIKKGYFSLEAIDYAWERVK